MPSDHDRAGTQEPSSPPWWKTRSGVVLCGFLLIAGFYLLMLTLLMFPLLVAMYVHLARTEEAEVRRVFGSAYDSYAVVTPAWLPRLGGPSSPGRPTTDVS